MPLISARQVTDSTVIYNFLPAEIDRFDESVETNSGNPQPQQAVFQDATIISNNESNRVYGLDFSKKIEIRGQASREPIRTGTRYKD